MKVSRLLAICPIGIGNFLLLAPALKRLNDNRPDLQITLLALKGGIAPIAERFPFIHDVISIDATKKNGFSEKMALLKKLFLKFDISMAFFPTNRREYNLLPLLSGVRRRIAFRYPSFGMSTLSFLNSVRHPVSPVLHDVEQNGALLSTLGINDPEPFSMLPFPLSESEVLYGHKWLRERGLEKERLTGIHPGSSAEHGMEKKRWPLDRFGLLAEKLLKTENSRFLIFGGREEQALKHELTERIGPSAVSVDTHSLFQSAAIMTRCHRFISNDSGLMHVAVSCGVPTCGIFGPTDDKRTAPFGEGHLVIRGLEPCSPCWTYGNVGRREECHATDFACLTKLSVDGVFESLRGWL